MTARIPDNLGPVIQILQRDVPKPSVKELWLSEFGPRWTNSDGIAVCPLGLHPDCDSPLPANESSMQERSKGNDRYRLFVEWWDALSLDDAKRVVQRIWKD